MNGPQTPPNDWTTQTQEPDVTTSNPVTDKTTTDAIPDRTTTENEPDPDDCEGVCCPDGGLKPNNEDPTKYYNCYTGSDGNWDFEEVTCPSGTAFNPALSICDWPCNIKSISPAHSKALDPKDPFPVSHASNLHFTIIFPIIINLVFKLLEIDLLPFKCLW